MRAVIALFWCSIKFIVLYCIRDIIVAYMNDYYLHRDWQHGVRKDGSCVTQLLHVVEDLSDMFDNAIQLTLFILTLKMPLIRSHIKDWL